MHVVVTGATGNVGTAVLRAIRANHPSWQVTGIARRLPDTSTAPYDGISWHSVDLSGDVEAELTGVLRGADAVLHSAWAIAPTWTPDVLQAVNVAGSRQVLRAAAAAGVPHLVLMSSVGAYAPVTEHHPKPTTDESWPATGIPTSLYSRQKAALEALADELEGGWFEQITRIRPGLVLQRAAGAAIGRYFAGSFAPAVRLVQAGLPVLPMPGDLVANVVHADDLGDLIVRAIDRRAGGAFNVAADEIVTPTVLAAAFSARRIPLPYAVLRAVVHLTWRVHLQPTEPGWLDLARGVPLMDTGRAKRLLDWAPRHTALDALTELVDALGKGEGAPTPVLEPR